VYNAAGETDSLITV